MNALTQEERENVEHEHENAPTKFELFTDCERRWVLTRDYSEENAPVFQTIQDAYNFLVKSGERPFTLMVHGVADCVPLRKLCGLCSGSGCKRCANKGTEP